MTTAWQSYLEPDEQSELRVATAARDDARKKLNTKTQVMKSRCEWRREKALDNKTWRSYLSPEERGVLIILQEQRAREQTHLNTVTRKLKPRCEHRRKKETTDAA